MTEKNIKIAAIQETKLSHEITSIDTGNYTLVRKDRDLDAGGGLAFLVHNSIQFVPLPDLLPADPHLEYLGIRVADLSIINVYIPPTSSCQANYLPDLTTILQYDNSIILGDFNAHDTLWHSTIQDDRGSKFAETIGDSNFGVLNEETPTRLPSNGRPTSPDFTLASLELLPLAEWKTSIKLSSDHLPIIISLSASFTTQPTPKRTYINFNKADWPKFLTDTDAEFVKLPPPTDVHTGQKIFQRIVNKISKRCIPAGRIKEWIPGIPTEAADMIVERDELRQHDPTSPDISRLTKEIQSSMREHKKQEWRSTVVGCGSGCSSKLFKLIKFLNGKGNNRNSNQAIKFNGKYISSAKSIADQFNSQYSSVVQQKSSSFSRIVKRNIAKNTLSDAPSFTPTQTAEAIRKSKTSKALGPDGLSNVHMKHLGPAGIAYLTKIYNLSMETSIIPDIWKHSIIIPLLKPGKDASESKSYRPVSLLCPAIKILERLILPSLNENLPIPDFQHGFRKNHSTVSALHDFNVDVTNGFNKKRPPNRTILVQLDLSKAFDMVNHDKLLSDINNTTLPGATKRWLSTYLRGRQSKVSFRDTTSKFRNVRTGVPQGAVTSPLLFSFYLTKLPMPPPQSNIKLIQYADDISVYICGPKKLFKTMEKELNKYMIVLARFLEERELAFSPEKSTVTLFTPDTKEAQYHPQVKLGNTIIPLEKTPKLLGVVFDTMYTFSHHVRSTVSKAKKQVNMMKALAGSTWGQDKETLSMTY